MLNFALMKRGEHKCCQWIIDTNLLVKLNILSNRKEDANEVDLLEVDRFL